MRFQFLVSLIAVIVLAGVVWYKETAHLCPVPLTYRIGSIDAKFQLDPLEAKEHIEKATLVWEETTGRELFEYDEKGTLVVDFVYDERQAGTKAEEIRQSELEAKRKETDSLQSEIDTLQRQYNDQSAVYEGRVTAYETRLAEYNQRVARYNDQGGAPGEIYAELENERGVLDVTAAELGTTAQTLNQLADSLNELGVKSNELVDAYNQDVEAYNQEFGFSKEFTQGDYLHNKINIYEFANTSELERVLVHELGHALGLEHVDDSSSVMYYLLENSSSTPVLGEADKEAFVSMCGTGEEPAHKLRAFVRKYLII